MKCCSLLKKSIKNIDVAEFYKPNQNNVLFIISFCDTQCDSLHFSFKAGLNVNNYPLIKLSKGHGHDSFLFSFFSSVFIIYNAIDMHY